MSQDIFIDTRKPRQDNRSDRDYWVFSITINRLASLYFLTRNELSHASILSMLCLLNALLMIKAIQR